MLSRRNLFTTAIGITAGLGLPAVRATSGKSGEAPRIGYILPRQSQLGAGRSALADEVAKRTGGRITRPAGATGSAAGRLTGRLMQIKAAHR